MKPRTKIKIKNKKCIKCKRTDQPHFSKKKCKSCAKKEYKPTKKTPIKKTVRKPTGEKKLFKEIWEEREHICEVCERQLIFSINIFAHILSKGAYPSLRLMKRNIALLCHDYVGTGCHAAWDTKPKSELKKKNKNWNKIIRKEQKLKQNFYKPKTTQP